MALPLDFTPDFAGDPVWGSLLRVLQFYNLAPDRALAKAQIPVDWNAPLDAAAALRICRHLGLEANHRLMRPADMQGLAMPALVWLPDTTVSAFLPGEALAAAPAADTVLNVITVEHFAAALDEFAPAGPPRLAWFWQPFWEYKKDFIDLALATFFINMFALAVPIYTKNVYDRVVPNHANETLLALTVGIVFVFAFNLAFKMVRGHILEIVAARLAARLDTDLMDRLLRLSVPEQRLTIGEKSDLFRELQNLRDFFATRLMPAVLDLPFFLLFLIVIYLISPGLLPVVLVGIAAMFAANLACGNSVNRAADTQFQSTRRKNAVLVELLAGAGAVRLFNAAGKQLLGWTRIAERSASTAQHSQHKVELAGDISITITYLVSVFIIVVGVYQIEKGELSVGSLIAGSILVSRAIAPIMTLSMVAGRFRQSLDSLKIIDRIFHLPAESKISADYAGKAPFKGGLELRDIVYYHPGQARPTLYHLSLAIAPGEKVGLIGRTGAGKSTVLGLIEGAIQPQAGLVLADGLVLDAIHPVEWRHHLGVVPQESFFFAGSVRDNILLGYDGAVDEEWFQSVLVTSGLDQLLRQSGFGVDFQVGENGLRLSGGQRQSVAIARALIRRPGLLLLDEPTNGMDNGLEQVVVRALREFARDTTLILVTHRTPLLELVDRLVLVDQGKISADGPRDDVLKMLAGSGGKASA